MSTATAPVGAATTPETAPNTLREFLVYFVRLFVLSGVVALVVKARPRLGSRAAVLSIAGAAFVLGQRAIVDGPSVLIGLVTLLALVYVRKIPEPIVILAAGVVGLLMKG